ncbi:S-adenosyl-L-methionine-dependent methyltransferase [Gymnopus androsaceus JB14]|uniref:S-adenosyl-L-methionine-dependent methyltransferase n=1 Tax=Gymnopus androsaceus JB14 TaxID=1447944 RepID=A0A6A4HIL3_9AGAR|nr:S-adenosyl-L-methionine-dependent methyltransferase [Gymnopus androsaceus JB14]
MATFAQTSFNAAVYSASRPTYPKALFQYVFDYHEKGPATLPADSPLKPRWDLAVDLGCGTGQATTELYPFNKVIGVEPSSVMVEKARKYVGEHLGGSELSSTQFEFVQSPAEELGFLENESVDLIISAQAVHWFDWNILWPEVARVLRPSGTIAFWTYSEFRLPQYPSLTPLITHYLQGTQGSTPPTSLDSLGNYWERPGRTILERHLVDIPEPSNSISLVTTTKTFSRSIKPSQVILRSQTTWNGLLGYFNTLSSLHTYLEKNPDDALKHGGKNLAQRTWEELLKGAEREKGNKEVRGEDELIVEWPVAMVLAKKM